MDNENRRLAAYYRAMYHALQGFERAPERVWAIDERELLVLARSAKMRAYIHICSRAEIAEIHSWRKGE